MGRRRFMVVALLPLICLARAAGAQSYSELTPQGYLLLKRTHVAGIFQGCQRNMDVTFADGTIFSCHESNHHYAYQPPVVLLKNRARDTYAVLIDGRAYKGGIRQYEGKPLARPMAAEDVHGGAADPILGADALPLPGVPQFAKTADAAKAETLIPIIPLAPGTQGGPPPDPKRKLNQNYP
jgi:hypothetical protein